MFDLKSLKYVANHETYWSGNIEAFLSEKKGYQPEEMSPASKVFK